MFLSEEQRRRPAGRKLARGEFEKLVAKARKRRQPNWAVLGVSPSEIERLHAESASEAAQDAARIEVVTRSRAARKLLKVLPLDQARALPAEATGEVVYFLWDGPRLLYIGKTVRFAARLEQHAAHGKRWQRATVLQVPQDWGRGIETAYVQRYRPPLNHTSSG